MKAFFVRHGQSMGNLGVRTESHSDIPLTSEGLAQAEALANTWTEPLTDIIVSPFLRARQTARPTSARFPFIEPVVWPIQEFTYLNPAIWDGTTPHERRPAVSAYWQALNPNHSDGEGAESFTALLRRAEEAISRLSSMPENSRVALFSHQQFIQAVWMTIEMKLVTDQFKMDCFLAFTREHRIGNGAVVSFTF